MMMKNKKSRNRFCGNTPLAQVQSVKEKRLLNNNSSCFFICKYGCLLKKNDFIYANCGCTGNFDHDCYQGSRKSIK